jgi:hypothetical protein
MTRDLSVRRRAVRMSFFLAAAVLSCTNDPVSSGSPYLVVPVTTAPLTGTAGWTLTDTLVVEIRTSNGRPASGVRVHWSLPQGGSLAVQRAGVDDSMTGTTDDLGRSSAVWTLGLPEGTQMVRVAAGLGDPATAFTATATVLHAMQVTVGGGYACAVLPDQRPVCWGDNRYGKLGTGDTLARAAPTPVQGLAAVRAIRASGGYTCALDLSGDVWCWGRNESGQVGPAGAQPLQLSPVRVAGADGAVSLSLSTADPFRGYTCAVLGAGGVSCWGNNSLGQLGTGDTISSATPRPVAGSGGFTNVYSGGILSCALDAAREAWCWGGARSGELAPLPKAVYTTPVRPVPGFTYTSLAVGAYAVCGIQVIGGTSCWGDDFGSFGHIPLSDLQPGDGPVHPDLSEPLAELASDGWNGYYARSTFGLGYVWGETGCCDVFTLPPQMITPSLRIEEISSGGPDYCVISESGGLYCGAVNWWFRGGRESLAGLPDRIGP